jgi:RNA polymerase sigma-70 factor, ECF subfamily
VRDTPAQQKAPKGSTHAMTAPEPELVRRAVGGDPDATAALLADLRPGIVRYCRAHLGRVGGAYTTADDLAQEVCLAVLRALPRFRDEGRPFTALVYRIAAHKVTDAQRAAVRHLAVDPVEHLVNQPDAAPGPEQQAVATDLNRRLSRLLGHLSETHREIVVLRVAVGLAADEVGSVLGMSAAAVRMAQSRALAHLRRLARDTLDEVPA